MSKINLKQLTNNIKDKKAADAATDAVEVKVIPENQASEGSVAQNENVKEVAPKAPTEDVGVNKNEESDLILDKQVSSTTSPLFSLDDVTSWKRPETVGKKKLVEIAKEYDTFFGKVKATTGVSTVKFVNYLIRDFLVKNPDFVRFINEESGKSPQLE
jgi:hypothetical protein